MFRFRLPTTALLRSTRRYSALRPNLDFDYLLAQENLEPIKKNIQERKGVGDIEDVHKKWAPILKQISNPTSEQKIPEEELKKLWDDFYAAVLDLPNMSHADVPRGSDPKEVESFGEKREGNMHTAETIVKPWRSLLSPLDASGERSYAFIGALANLERVLLDYVFDRVCALGFKPVVVPDLVDKTVTEACGVVQRSNQAIQYMIAGEDQLALSGTAEMGIAALLRGRTFQPEQLPIRLVAISRCFRPEISKSAAEAKLYRVHEFSKVEMFTVCAKEDSDAELDFLVQIQKGTFQSLGLHCRLLEMPSEELGAAASRKFDIEAWMPGRKLYGEVSSASNCTDFQARRLEIQYKDKGGKPLYAHTCNGTAIASTRTLVALLETFQNEKKGLLELPKVLRDRLTTQRPAPLRFQQAQPLS